MATKKVKVYIDADTKGLDRGLKGANARLGGFGKKAIGAAAGFVTIGAALGEVKKSVGVVQTLAKGTAGLSRATGMDTEEASRWVAIARSRGIESAKLGTSFTTLSKQIRAAGQGSKQSVQAFKELGVSQADIKKGDISQIIGKVSDGMAKMGPGAERTALASKLFGKSYSALMPLLADGSKNLKESLELSDKYGLTLSKGQAKAALEAAKNQREMNMAMDGLRVAIGTTLMPIVADATEALSGFIQSFRSPDGLGKKLVDDAKSVVAEVTGILEDAGIKQPKRNKDMFSLVMGKPKEEAKSSFKNDVKDVFSGLSAVASTVWPSVRQRLTGFVQGLSGLTKTLGGLVRGDWGRMWEGMKQTARGGLNTLISTVRPGFDILRAVFGGMIRSAVSAVSREARKMWNAGRKTMNELKDGAMSQIGPISRAGSKAGNAIRSAVASTWKAMYSVGGFVMDKIKDGLSAGISGLSSIGSRIVSAIKSGIGGVISIPFRLFGKGKQRGGRAARGGMLGGHGLQDTVPVWAAPGEAFLTRHQQVPVEAALAATFGMSLDDVFQNRRPHSSPMTFGKGGRRRKATARKVRSFNRSVELQDARDAAYTDPRWNVNLPARLAKIDKLLKSRGLSREDRISLLNQRGQVVDAIASSDTAQSLIDATEAQTAAIKENTDVQQQSLDFAQRMHTATRGVNDTLLQGVVDKTIGGQLSTALLTTGARFAT